MLVAPASMAQSSESPPQVCTMTRAPPSFAAATAAANSAFENIESRTDSAGVATPAVATNLIQVAPFSRVRATAARTVETLPASSAPIMSTLICSRGPASEPSATASRKVASAPPASRRLVTPPRRVAARAPLARDRRSSGERRSRSSRWKSAHDTCEWQS